MSRRQPFMPKATEAAKPAAGPHTCSDCKHWREQADPSLGLCLLNPPSMNRGPSAFGPLCVYPVTESTTPACGRGELA